MNHENPSLGLTLLRNVRSRLYHIQMFHQSLESIQYSTAVAITRTLQETLSEMHWDWKP